jgi:hypothetical protein
MVLMMLLVMLLAAFLMALLMAFLMARFAGRLSGSDPAPGKRGQQAHDACEPENEHPSGVNHGVTSSLISAIERPDLGALERQ